MREYLEKMLHCPIVVKKYIAPRNLPLAISGNYALNTVSIYDRVCIFAKPSADVKLSAVRKQQKRLEILTGMVCVLHLQRINAYTKEHLIEEGIPFVVENKQIYLPFLGVALSDEDERVFTHCGQISFLTQKLLLSSIYEKWKDISVSEAAKRLAVTKTSVTRCYDEIEALEFPYIRKKSRARLFSAETDLRKMWENLQGIMRNPVLQQFSLRNDLKEANIFGGLSALGFYSMLNDNPYPVYAISKKEVRKILDSHEQIRMAYDIPGCVIQEVGYMIPFGNGQAADPLSVALMLTDEEMDDPRVSKAVDEMLEEEVWSKA